MENEAIQSAATALQVVVDEKDPAAQRQALAYRINELIQSDFHQLLSILYRLDVQEEKLRRLLNEHPGTDAGLLIADLMIERQLQKIKSRREFKQRDNDIDADEKW